MFVLGMLAFLVKSKDVADLISESSFVGFFKPRPKLTFAREPARLAFIPYSATPTFLEQIPQRKTLAVSASDRNPNNSTLSLFRHRFAIPCHFECQDERIPGALHTLTPRTSVYQARLET